MLQLVLALKNNLLQNRSERILSARLVYPRLTLLREDNIFLYNFSTVMRRSTTILIMI